MLLAVQIYFLDFRAKRLFVDYHYLQPPNHPTVAETFSTYITRKPRKHVNSLASKMPSVQATAQKALVLGMFYKLLGPPKNLIIIELYFFFKGGKTCSISQILRLKTWLGLLVNQQ